MLRDKSGDERTKGAILRALPVGGMIRPKGAVRRRVRYLGSDPNSNCAKGIRMNRTRLGVFQRVRKSEGM